MSYIRLKDKKYPVTESEIRQEYSNTSFAVPFSAPDTYAYVFPTPQPTINKISQTVVETTPEFTNKNVWEQRWNIVQLDDANILKNTQEFNKNFMTEVVKKVQSNLDNFAKQKNYDSILSLCTYASSSIQKFKTEGQLGVTLRDSTWDKLYQILADVESGKRDMPTIEQIELELPVLTWQ